MASIKVAIWFMDLYKKAHIIGCVYSTHIKTLYN